jgi:hypothetical protein
LVSYHSLVLSHNMNMLARLGCFAIVLVRP